MGSVGTNPLFTPLKIGNITLKHRVIMAPLTRYRSTKKEHVPLDMVAEYYEQRASVPGTLLITEATFIHGRAGGYDSIPGIWTDDQIASWRKVTERVHNKGSFIYLQMWALGRAGYAKTLEEDGYPYVSSSATPFKSRKDGKIPREMTKQEIKEFVELYAQAAENAVFKAGFDGVEIHGANGYLVDQFLQDVVNKRTDEYGGSIENRSRFGLEVAEAVINRVGAERTGIRLSPYGTFQEMKMENLKAQFTHFISQLASRHPNMAYLHLTESRVTGNVDLPENPKETLDFAREAWRVTGRPFFAAGGFTREKALEHMKVEGRENDAVVFGRYFISNPDLPKRIEKDIPFTPYNRDTFYTPQSPVGYIDYPAADAEKL